MTVAESSVTSPYAIEIVPGDVPGGPSTSQTIMASSLRRLLALVPADAEAGAYRTAVMDENILAKDTAGGREWAFRQLRRFYALDPHSLLFRALRDLWADEQAGQCQLPILCALARDSVLHATAPLVIQTEAGERAARTDLQPAIDAAFP